MVSLLVGQIIKYRLGVPVVAMESRIRVQSRNPVKYVRWWRLSQRRMDTLLSKKFSLIQKYSGGAWRPAREKVPDINSVTRSLRRN